MRETQVINQVAVTNNVDRKRQTNQNVIKLTPRREARERVKFVRTRIYVGICKSV